MRSLATSMAALLLAACGAKDHEHPPAQSPLERGEYLVQHVGMCVDCHSPMTPTGPDPTKLMQGAALPFGPLVPIPNWAKQAPKLAGLTTITREHVIKVLTEGVTPDGDRPNPPMPPYRLTKSDAGAVATYLASLK